MWCSSSSGSTAHGGFPGQEGGLRRRRKGEEEKEDTRVESSTGSEKFRPCFSPQASWPAEVCTAGKNSQDFRTLCNMFSSHYWPQIGIAIKILKILNSHTVFFYI